MKTIHFEIGHMVCRNELDGVDETESVFSSSNLSDCLKEFARKGYTQPEYFVDTWEAEDGEPSYPIADIKIDDNMLAPYIEEKAESFVLNVDVNTGFSIEKVAGYCDDVQEKLNGFEGQNLAIGEAKYAVSRRELTEIVSQINNILNAKEVVKHG